MLGFGKKITATELESIQLDYGVVYMDYGEATVLKVGPTNGGVKFDVTPEGHYLKIDGCDDDMGTYVVDKILAKVSAAVKNASIAMLEKQMPYATNDAGTIKVGRANLGLVAEAQHAKNVTIFGRKVGGKYLKITVFNPMNIGGMSLSFAPKAEGEYQMELSGHMDPKLEEDTDLLFTITEIDSFADDYAAAHP